MVGVAEQGGALGAGAGGAHHDVAGVEIPLECAAGRGLEQATADARVGELGRERLLRGVDQLDAVPALDGQRGALIVGETVELVDGDVDPPALRAERLRVSKRLPSSASSRFSSRRRVCWASPSSTPARRNPRSSSERA
ncbi:hypothetical protein [Tessaracoccus coleopterorum]|uniref:hypothetical protein n=1 Tax=Tessaracoccus coleopterorum TaxID=2714950 RepID=UPI001E51E219|nr:hypothetical protein [Tessaracoccus coleopterorum]